MKIMEMSAEERPREKLLSAGAESLSNGELLAVLLRSGYYSPSGQGKSALEIAQELLALTGGRLLPLAGMSAKEILSVKGIKSQKAATLLATIEFGRRFVLEQVGNKPRLMTPDDTFRFVFSRFKGLVHEELWTVFLNASNMVQDFCRMAEGGDFSAVIDNRKILRMALDKHSASIIIVHNHPSNDPRPSVQDTKATESLRKAAAALDISLLDHLVVSDGGYFSFSEGAVKSV